MPRRPSSRARVVIALLAVGIAGHFLLLLSCSGGGGGPSNEQETPTWQAATGNCISCHQGIETAHLRYAIGCTTCHGGNPDALSKEEAHVQPQAPLPQDPTILPIDYFDLPYLRFVNPTNLRVVRQTCGQSGQGLGTACHSQYVDDVMKSMMATTAGHLAGGGYQNGILPDRQAVWANMPISDDDGDVPTEQGALPSLIQMPAELTSWPVDSFQRHYSDVPRKICMRCHLWSRGKAIRGIPGQEGNYRSEGCAACHVLYATDALSQSGDSTIPHGEVGHPRIHRITRKIDTDQCSRCHTRGARIGLSYRGLAQLPPGTPTGPNYPGLTPEPVHGSYHVQNPDVNPPDIHMERGMHCIDCHVRVELMGDGNIYGHMDKATQIECTDCHGTLDEYATFVTSKGVPHTNMRWENGQAILTSKVTGQEHVAKQVKDITNPLHANWNPTAYLAMNPTHLKAEGGLECYACHSAWQNNCYGCHFERDLTQTSLDYVQGIETPGKPKTAKKYFLNFKAFHMGYNAEGRIAPYVTGCQAVATVKDENGQLIMKQKVPVTAAGLSGLALQPVHPHTNRKTPRFCVECHNNPAALGLGTDSFNLTRRYLFALSPAPSGALQVIDRSDPAAPQVVGSLALPDPRDMVVVTDQISGEAATAYIADGTLGLAVVDLSTPTQPALLNSHFIADARDAVVGGTTLYVAAGTAGIMTFDISDPANPTLLGSEPTAEARALKLHGLVLLVADGPVGLTVVNVKNPANPMVLATLDFNGNDPTPNDASDVCVLPHYSNPPAAGPKPFKEMVYVADGANGVRVVNLDTYFTPMVVATFPTTDARAVFAKFHYDSGSATEVSIEREYLFVADGTGGVVVANITNPMNPVPVTSVTTLGAVTDLMVCNAFEPPLNKEYLYAALGTGGCAILDFSDIQNPVTVSTVPVNVTRGLDLERILLDRMVDEDGVQIKDVSHEGARPFNRAEIERILGLNL